MAGNGETCLAMMEGGDGFVCFALPSSDTNHESSGSFSKPFSE